VGPQLRYAKRTVNSGRVILNPSRSVSGAGAGKTDLPGAAGGVQLLGRSGLGGAAWVLPVVDGSFTGIGRFFCPCRDTSAEKIC
jgi:hypothetical protein